MVDFLRERIRDRRVLDAFAVVPRERFVESEYRARAYGDSPLPIGYRQTISQPLIVAMMLELLELKGEDKVLDIGTGSGYQAALLSLLCREVVSVERIPQLADRARETLAALGYGNVQIHTAGEELGWPAGAPYDAIVVAAAAPRVPDALTAQLAAGGRMVLPVGGRSSQELTLLRKGETGVMLYDKGACRFVPLIGEGAFSSQEWLD
jgi:protein-L-isoaspartate(D-aspartate) O-methyltransferase